MTSAQVARALASSNEISEIRERFEMQFFDALPDDRPHGRGNVRMVCADFIRSRAVERLIVAVPICMELILAHVAMSSESTTNATALSAQSDEIERAVHKAKRAVTQAIDCMWNASARPDTKCPMIESGVVPFVVKLHADLLRVAPSDAVFFAAVCEASMGVVPNLTQARFAHGHRNVHLASLIADSGCVPYLVGFLDEAEASFDLGHRATKREELRLWFLAINALANLSLDPTHGASLRPHWSRFDKFWLNSLSVMHAADIFHFWNSFSPFACLLDAPHPHIARWALRCLCEFARDGVPRVFRALAVVSSVDSVRYWCTVEETAQYAESLVQLLGVDGEPGQPHVLAPPPATGAPALDRQALAAFSDIDLVVIDDEGREANCIAAHRVVLAGRSTFFAALFASGMRDANDRRIRIVDVDPAAFAATIEFAYSGNFPTHITAQLAVDLVTTIVRFGVGADDALRKLEYLLCLQIDSQETALALLELCGMHDSALPRLRAQVTAFLARAEVSNATMKRIDIDTDATSASAPTGTEEEKEEEEEEEQSEGEEIEE
jgi:hypothetical protein